MTGAKAGRAVAAVLLPPLGVFLDRDLGRAFWIASGLTCLAWLPGVAYALWTVLAHR